MEFTNEFRVPSDIETTFATLTDLEKVAPCLPGATLEEVDGDTYKGKVKVKVGPVTVLYAGTARMAEIDADAKRGRIEASGKETRGTGTAKADVVASLVEDGEGTRVTVVTDLAVTGKPAQFGRGVMGEVGAKIIDAFADRLRTMMEEEGLATTDTGTADAGGEPAETTAATDAEPAATSSQPADASTEPASGGAEPSEGDGEAAGPRRIEPQPGRENDALNLMDVAGPAAVKRLVPVIVAVIAIVVLIWWLQR